MKHKAPKILKPIKLTHRQMKPSGDGYIVFDSDIKRIEKKRKKDAKKQRIKDIKSW
jgi:hypothetical protein